MKIVIINGPNLNLLGSRAPDIYGTTTFESFLTSLRVLFPKIEIEYFQSNWEGGIVDYIQQSKNINCNGILLNAAAYTHTSIAIADAIEAVAIPTIEIHISNVFAREAYRQQSFIASKCIGSISGLGLMGYQLGIEYFLNLQK